MTDPTKQRLARLLRERATYPETTLTEIEGEVLEEYEDEFDRGEYLNALSSVSAFAEGVPVNRGMRQILAGDLSGWQDIERAFLLQSITVRAFGSPAGGPAAALLVYAIVRGDAEIAAWMANVTEQRLVERVDAWRSAHFPPFALALYRRWSTRAEFGSLPGVYDDIARVWTSGALAAALDAMLEYHLDDVIDQEKVGAEFLTFDLIPVELAAIRAVRKAENLSTPDPTHPLARTALAAVPEGSTGYDASADPWALRALEAARRAKVLPDTWEPARRR